MQGVAMDLRTRSTSPGLQQRNPAPRKECQPFLQAVDLTKDPQYLIWGRVRDS